VGPLPPRFAVVVTGRVPFAGNKALLYVVGKSADVVVVELTAVVEVDAPLLAGASLLLQPIERPSAANEVTAKIEARRVRMPAILRLAKKPCTCFIIARAGRFRTGSFERDRVDCDQFARAKFVTAAHVFVELASTMHD
jgi:hypothetical protein